MPNHANTEFRLNVLCPHCDKLVNMDISIKTDFKEAEIEKETEGKANETITRIDRSEKKESESSGVRPDYNTGLTGTKDSIPEPTDSGKSKADKRTGGKTK